MVMPSGVTRYYQAHTRTNQGSTGSGMQHVRFFVKLLTKRSYRFRCIAEVLLFFKTQSPELFSARRRAALWMCPAKWTGLLP
jgi:hypothetical protein